MKSSSRTEFYEKTIIDGLTKTIITKISRVSVQIRQTQEANDSILCNDCSNSISTLFEELLKREGLDTYGGGNKH